MTPNVTILMNNIFASFLFFALLEHLSLITVLNPCAAEYGYLQQAKSILLFLKKKITLPTFFLLFP